MGAIEALRRDAEDFTFYIGSVASLSENTVRSYRSHLDTYILWLDDTRLDPYRLTLRDARRFVRDLQRRGCLPKTLAAYLSTLRSFYSWLLLDGRIDSDVFASLSTPKIPKTLPHVLSHEQMASLLAAPDRETPAGLRDACMLELLYASGARISELSALDIGSVDFSSRTVRLFGKGSKERIVPLYARALTAVSSYLQDGRPAFRKQNNPDGSEDGSGALFLSTRGNRMPAASMRKRFHELCALAGLPRDIAPHAMRHTFATDLLDGGADLRSVQELLGHASLSTTQLYTHVTPSRLKAEVCAAHPRG